MKAFSPAWYAQATPGMLEPGSEVMARAKAFLLAKWRERAAERGDGVPVDLSRACKFSSLFTKIVFGGSIAGNRDHQFVVREGRVIDLNAEARDVMALPHAYRAEPGFIGNPEHHESMKSCAPRVKKWTQEFLATEKARDGEGLLPAVPGLRGMPAAADREAGLRGQAPALKKGMLTLFHGTSSVHREDIFRDGLRSPFLTDQRDLAAYYAAEVVDADGGTSLILQVRVDPKFLRYDGCAMDEPVSFGPHSIADLERQAKRAWSTAAKAHPEWTDGDIVSIPPEQYQISLKAVGSCWAECVIPPAQIAELGHRLPEVPNLGKLNEVQVSPAFAGRNSSRRR